MKIRFTHTPLLLLFLAVAAIGCKDDDAPANTPPTFTVVSPTDAEIQAGFDRGQTVQISGTVADNSLVETITTEVYFSGVNTGQGETITIGERSAPFDYTVAIPTTAPAGSYRVVLIATDDEGATTNWDRTFQVR